VVTQLKSYFKRFGAKNNQINSVKASFKHNETTCLPKQFYHRIELCLTLIFHDLVITEVPDAS
jgi:hypothetical protein